MLVQYESNLYQYHLLHGVLTINEVRKTLGLPSVPWGDKPTGRNLANQPGDGTGALPGGRDIDPADEEAEPDEGVNDARIR